MIRKITCIDCPQGCQLEVNIENHKVVSITGNRCKKGITYARQEIENPMRTLTATVFTEGLPIKMLPVRTNRQIPKDKVMLAMTEINKIKINKPVRAGEIILKDLLGLGADLIATRSV